MKAIPETEHRKTRKVLAAVTFPVGGIRTFMRYTYSSINTDKYVFDVLTCESGEIDALGKDMRQFNAHELIVSKPFRGRHFLFPALYRALRSAKYDLIHSHGIFAGASVCIVNRFFGVPHIITVHGLLEESDFKGPSIIRRTTLSLLGRILGSTTVIHHVGQDMLQEYRNLFPNQERSGCKIVHIPNGIDVAHYAAVKRISHGKIRKTLEIDSNTFLIGYLGRFMPRKGFPILVRAVEIIERQSLISKDYVLVAIGSGDREKPYKRDIHSKGLSKKIRFLPFQYDVAPVIAEMDLVVMPSLWEAWPLLPAEVLCVGVALIASDCLGLRKVIEGTPSIVVPPNDPQALAEAIAKAATSPPRHAFERFRQEACNRFDIDRTAEEIERLFDTVTGPSHS